MKKLNLDPRAPQAAHKSLGQTFFANFLQRSLLQSCGIEIQLSEATGREKRTCSASRNVETYRPGSETSPCRRKEEQGGRKEKAESGTKQQGVTEGLTKLAASDNDAPPKQTLLCGALIK